MKAPLDAPLESLKLHPTIEALLLEAGCRTILELLSLPHATLMRCGISLKELAEIVEQVAEPRGD